MFKAVREWVKKKPMGLLVASYFAAVRRGAKIYNKILDIYGEDVIIFNVAWRGTGDYYFVAAMLRDYVEKKHITNYVVLTPPGSEKKVLQLFNYLDEHIYVLAENEEWWLQQFRSFSNGKTGGQLVFLHHQMRFQTDIELNLSMSDLTAYNGAHMIDYYKYFGFQMGDLNYEDASYAEISDETIDGYFEKYGLKKGKTVVLAPYSTGLKKYLPGQDFWGALAWELEQKGFSVVTNCFGEQEPVLGSVAAPIPYKDMVPFLEAAGYFIGIRSGLCDIVACAKCEKIVIHINEAQWWPEGKSLEYTGLNHMGICDDAKEFIFSKKEPLVAINNILDLFI